ncbi:MAG TPA: sulfite exporter TauE/SafE family protein [Anaeromyxobacteraceae bacterium]|nr:sulfite exporter TauE/SafE family protein [Anaeromyxobacteraceae bacterium]
MTHTGLLLAFGTGLLGGFGHCVGMCGPLLLAFGLATPGAPARGLRPQLAYHAGRVTTYGLVGAAMGLAGSFVNVAGRMAGLQDAVAVLAGALMVALGASAAVATGGLRSLEGRLAGGVVRAARGLVEDAVGRAYPLGLLMGLLPCGLSYSAFAGAAATGGPATGFLFALSFGAGTLPALLAAGWVAGLVSARARGLAYRAGGALVALLGILFVLRGLHVHAPL